MKIFSFFKNENDEIFQKIFFPSKSFTSIKKSIFEQENEKFRFFTSSEVQNLEFSKNIFSPKLVISAKITFEQENEKLEKLKIFSILHFWMPKFGNFPKNIFSLKIRYFVEQNTFEQENENFFRNWKFSWFFTFESHDFEISLQKIFLQCYQKLECFQILTFRGYRKKFQI